MRTCALVSGFPRLDTLITHCLDSAGRAVGAILRSRCCRRSAAVGGDSRYTASRTRSSTSSPVSTTRSGGPASSS